MKYRFGFAVALFSCLLLGSEPVVSTGDANYSQFPTAPLSIRGGLKTEKGEEYWELNQKYVLQKTACHFYPLQEATEDFTPPNSRTKIVGRNSSDKIDNANRFLKACEEIKKEYGSGACSAVEIGGHANGSSIGLGGFFAFKIVEGKWKTYPEDQELFNKIVGCLKDISQKNAPIIFATCGGYIEEGESTIPKAKDQIFFFDKKKESQDLLSDILDRPVISARGPENDNWHWDKSFPHIHSRYGWYRSEPGNRKWERHFSPSEHLPKPEPLYHNDGSTKNSKQYPFGYDEKTDKYLISE